MDDQSTLPGKPGQESGYLRVLVTKNGLCAVLTSDLQDSNQYLGFLWPKGYRVAKERLGIQVLDAHGRWVANDDDFLYVRGTELDQSVSVQQRCTHRWGTDLVIQQVSKPGKPFGVAQKPVVLLDCQGMPQSKPRTIMLACDGGLSLKRVTYDTWDRDGATGTAFASGSCSITQGFGPVPVEFAYHRAKDYHALLALHGVDVTYEHGDPCP